MRQLRLTVDWAAHGIPDPADHLVTDGDLQRVATAGNQFAFFDGIITGDVQAERHVAVFEGTYKQRCLILVVDKHHLIEFGHVIIELDLDNKTLKYADNTLTH